MLVAETRRRSCHIMTCHLRRKFVWCCHLDRHCLTTRLVFALGFTCDHVSVAYRYHHRPAVNIQQGIRFYYSIRRCVISTWRWWRPKSSSSTVCSVSILRPFRGNHVYHTTTVPGRQIVITNRAHAWHVTWALINSNMWHRPSFCLHHDTGVAWPFQLVIR